MREDLTPQVMLACTIPKRNNERLQKQEEAEEEEEMKTKERVDKESEIDEKQRRRKQKCERDRRSLPHDDAGK